MPNITLKDGSIRAVEPGATALALAKELGAGLYKAVCAARIGGKVVDLRTQLQDGDTLELLTFDDPDGKKAFNHTASHILAQAVKRLYPEVKLTIGPAIEDGFYYDFDSDLSFTQEELAKIEAEMKKIVKEDLPIERFTLPAPEAVKLMEEKSEPYKVELINEHAGKGEPISFYKQGEFTELCAGPHLPDTGRVKAFKLTSSTGAYWRGDAKNKMLRRVYGTAFPKKAELDAHITMLEEARKRDHNKLGRELGFFTTVDYIGQGLPVMLPKGSRVLQLLQRFVEDEEEKRGYLLTKTPLLAKSDLYKISGHWDHYRDGMFVLGDEEKDDEVFALRPMTCPFQFQVYLNKKRSYRDLPMRLGETSTLFRNEASGEMHGLIRVRQFTISEGHIACRPDQLEEEFKGCVDLANFMLKTVGLDEDVSYRFSKWDENDRDKYIGTSEQWEEVQDRMRNILDDLGIQYTEASGEAAFYGPKLDIQIRNVFGKEDTLITVQIDFQLAKRFEMKYTDTDGQEKYPYVIHRTSIGCYERTLALLIEKYAGAMPTWLAPEQVRVLPISEKHEAYAQPVLEKLRAAGLRATVDQRNEKIGYRIREAQLEKVPYMLVAGDREAEEGTVSVRARVGEGGTQTVDAFLKDILQEIAEKRH
ncbi:threonine--tRNA ligase [Ethanoligenens harbinense]|uniref:Threonine--tRNA ligase n=1 Tax=Ethanoligenens harbinense (strain DSM 18485 / JCM 12961 / CGMCC 1.5033 / YUAN-3) TaxID=663278 RepID=E6U6N9_ETHHY|nr:threonine--tRNA ligase [Ethanoligenens harbinense]ADU25772.1 threonyl-tRNA synthetase [Ethanoligenens harbinense YUAN-3]AVQ94942.1 threonine--tRNA ligase [Ethanoligenens harbinense YUAN-3]AYF37634.1 threonine--tRNA ligase [Ethanoligenens harbinense]AYF40354.1 threonine--tRNA ligase [Ethanoligenens harbinense]QCN91190.1 threonine--tRNA ligase [Ethanoligenens harbinense]